MSESIGKCLRFSNRDRGDKHGRLTAGDELYRGGQAAHVIDQHIRVEQQPAWHRLTLGRPVELPPQRPEVGQVGTIGPQARGATERSLTVGPGRAFEETVDGLADELALAPARLTRDGSQGTAFGWLNLTAGVMLLPASVVFGWVYQSVAPFAAFAFSGACAVAAALLLVNWVGVKAPART